LDILQLREKRDAFERSLIVRSGRTLLTLRGNYPGENKDHPLVTFVVETLREEVRQRFHVEEEYHSQTKEGLFFYFLLLEEGEKAKRKAVALEENHPLGRLADVDVRDGEKIYSRKGLGLPERTCYLWLEKAVLCVRSQKHPLKEVLDYFENQVRAYRVLVGKKEESTE